MIPDEKTIKSRSMGVYKALSNALRCTFDELQNQCKLQYFGKFLPKN